MFYFTQSKWLIFMLNVYWLEYAIFDSRWFSWIELMFLKFYIFIYNKIGTYADGKYF